MRQIDQSHELHMQRLDLNPGQSDITYVRLLQPRSFRWHLGHLLKVPLPCSTLKVSTEDGGHPNLQAKVVEGGITNITGRWVGFIPAPPQARHGNTWLGILASEGWR